MFKLTVASYIEFSFWSEKILFNSKKEVTAVGVLYVKKAFLHLCAQQKEGQCAPMDSLTEEICAEMKLIQCEI